MAKKTMLLIALLISICASFSYAQNQTISPNCHSDCFGVKIPYPFGVGEGCYRDRGFEIICNTRSNFSILGVGGYIVTEISMTQLKVRSRTATNCYDTISGKFLVVAGSNYNYNFTNSPYTLSSTKNKLFGVGCDIFVHTTDNKDPKDLTGCVSLCPNGNPKLDSCSGIGCCRTTIPKGLKLLNLTIDTINTPNQSGAKNSSGCSFAALQDIDEIPKRRFFKYFGMPTPVSTKVVLDWVIGEEPCDVARNSATFACRGNSYCVNSSNGPGYRCICSHGYTGNPYLPNGCQDINECEGPNNCVNESTCINVPGSYYCSCLWDSSGDGRIDGSGCERIPHHRNHQATVLLIVVRCETDPKFGFSLGTRVVWSLYEGIRSRLMCVTDRDVKLKPAKSPLTVADFIELHRTGIGVGVGLLVLVALGFFLNRELRKRKNISLKQRFFKKNGGLLLEQEISSGERNIEKTKLFEAEELRKATNNFSESRVVGKGGSGTVYKGMLSDGRIVAIKKSKVVDESQIGQFINELVLLSRINHRHIVQLFGCCLETEVPLLAYEFVSNGTLAHHLHHEDCKSSISWDNRLRIATEIAGAISYMHSSSTTPIFHRDIKSSNILLDENFKAKVSDFGISRSVPNENTHLTTLVQGTFGYLDPEYFHSSQFTDKSDVYSFGVVLVELLTGQKPISSTRSEEEKNLVMHFISLVNEDRVTEILETRVLSEGSREEILVVAKLANRCLKLEGKKRPTMREVTMALERLRLVQEDEQVLQNHQEVEYWPYDLASVSMSGPESEDSRMILDTGTLPSCSE